MFSYRMPAHPGPDPVTPEPEPFHCGLLRRLLVMMYDALVIIVLLMSATGIVMVLQLGNPTAGKDPLYTLYLACVWFLYVAWCWRRGGMTLGMRAWRVRLVTQQGKPISWRQCAARFLGGFVSAVPLGLGYLWSLVDRERLAWHDRLSGTRLVRF